jgi:PAS domain S-box-containing protein
LRNEAEYYRSVLDNLGGGFLSVDLEGRVVYGNPTAGRILHLPMTAVLGKPYAEALAPYPALCGVVRSALETLTTAHRAEVSILHGDAEIVIGYSTFQVRTPAGERLGVGVNFQDLTLIARREKKAPGLSAEG